MIYVTDYILREWALWNQSLTNEQLSKGFSVERAQKVSSGMLHNEYCSLIKNPVVDRAYRNYIWRMVSLGLIKSEGKGRWKSFEIVS